MYFGLCFYKEDVVKVPGWYQVFYLCFAHLIILIHVITYIAQ